MPYTLNNQASIIDLAELGELNDPRVSSELSTSKYLINNQTIQNTYNKKLIRYYSGYIYSKEAGISNNFLIQNNSYSVAKRGCRPSPAYNRVRWSSSTPGTYYINRFQDGEIWLSSTSYSRTGTRISNSQQNMSYVFIMLHGAGGGGASGLSTGEGGGGGGGGSFVYGCCYIPIGSSIITIGSGGSGGSGGAYVAGGNSGNAGGSTKLTLSGIGTVTAGGGSRGSRGSGGSGGVNSRISNSYYNPLNWSDHAAGGGDDSANGGAWNTFDLVAYNPENKTLNVGGGQGGTSPSGMSTGGGGGAGLYYGWSGGNGGVDAGAGGNGNKGAGGGGGGWLFAVAYWGSGAGGRGGDGYAAIYY